MQVSFRTLTLLAATFFIGAPMLASAQSMCPIMIETENDGDEVVRYKGKEVFLCCSTCTRMWEANPDYYAKVALTLDLLPQFKDDKEKLLAEDLKDIELLEQRFCPLRPESVVSPDSPFVEYEGKKIYFFRERDIERRWTPSAEEKFAEAREAGLLPQFDE
ncbi:MAG: hypothetical protein AAGF67_11760 [Verrucomicrobiota bacterium]